MASSSRFIIQSDNVPDEPPSDSESDSTASSESDSESEPEQEPKPEPETELQQPKPELKPKPKPIRPVIVTGVLRVKVFSRTLIPIPGS